jgi:hypothetical protein
MANKTVHATAALQLKRNSGIGLGEVTAGLNFQRCVVIVRD